MAHLPSVDIVVLGISTYVPSAREEHRWAASTSSEKTSKRRVQHLFRSPIAGHRLDPLCLRCNLSPPMLPSCGAVSQLRAHGGYQWYGVRTRRVSPTLRKLNRFWLEPSKPQRSTAAPS